MAAYLLLLRPEYAATRGMFSRSGHAGYTNEISEAGRYSQSDADAAVAEAPDKYIAIPSPDAADLLARVRSECDVSFTPAMRDELEWSPDEVLVTGPADLLRELSEALGATP